MSSTKFSNSFMLSNLASTILNTQTSEEKVCRPTPHISLFAIKNLFLEIHLPLTAAEMPMFVRCCSHELRCGFRPPMHTTARIIFNKAHSRRIS